MSRGGHAVHFTDFFHVAVETLARFVGNGEISPQMIDGCPIKRTFLGFNDVILVHTILNYGKTVDLY